MANKKLKTVVETKKTISFEQKEYRPRPHPFEDRIKDVQKIQSLVTGGKNTRG